MIHGAFEAELSLCYDAILLQKEVQKTWEEVKIEDDISQDIIHT